MALIHVETHRGERLLTVAIPVESGWGGVLQRELPAIIAALQDALDRDASVDVIDVVDPRL